ncbi:MAG: hypothetical protein LBP98_03205 [Tannerella sp.]|jgi:hypothetical protein|nr:hypothetical protein [Tannerella sp.]
MNYVTVNIEQLLAWSAAFFSYLKTNMSTWGVSATWVTEVETKMTDVQHAYAVWANPATRTKAAHTDLLAKRVIYAKAIEPLVQNLRSLPTLALQDYDILQIAPPNKGPHPKYPPITTWPLLSLQVHGQGTVDLEYHDVETPLSRAKPRGAQSAFVRIGFRAEPPTSPEELTDVLLSITRTPHHLTLPPQYVGQKCWAVGAWISTVGEPGPWGPFVEVVLA